MADVIVTITTDNGINRVLVHIDDVDVTTTGPNPVSLNAGAHALRWWAAGAQGAKLQMIVTPVGAPASLVNVQTSISNIGLTAGHETFTV